MCSSELIIFCVGLFRTPICNGWTICCGAQGSFLAMMSKNLKKNFKAFPSPGGLSLYKCYNIFLFCVAIFYNLIIFNIKEILMITLLFSLVQINKNVLDLPKLQRAFVIGGQLFTFTSQPNLLEWVIIFVQFFSTSTRLLKYI